MCIVNTLHEPLDSGLYPVLCIDSRLLTDLRYVRRVIPEAPRPLEVFAHIDISSGRPNARVSSERAASSPPRYLRWVLPAGWQLQTD